MYGFFISLGILISALLAEKLAIKHNKNTNILWTGLFIAIVAGIIGARIYHVLDYFDYYSSAPLQIFALNQGGLGIPGGIIFGGISLVIYLKLKNQPIAYWTDLAATVLPLGQSIGRWGNYFNNELMPYAIYESILDFLLFIALFFISKKSTKPGLITLLYILGYILVRLLLMRHRTDFWLI